MSMTLKTSPIITHTEIIARAIRSINEEINDWKEKCECFPEPQKDEMFAHGTYELSVKLDALKTLYRIETGKAFD